MHLYVGHYYPYLYLSKRQKIINAQKYCSTTEIEMESFVFLIEIDKHPIFSIEREFYIHDRDKKGSRI